MTVDPIEHYGLSPEVAEAAMATLDAIAAREGSALPSSDVIAKALTVLGTNAKDRDVSHRVSQAIVYKVPSSSRPGRKHLAVLYTGWAGMSHSGEIIDAECSCEATGVCFHLLVALTLAKRDGYSLETNREEN